MWVELNIGTSEAFVQLNAGTAMEKFTYQERLATLGLLKESQTSRWGSLQGH
jgi:hypothetical protein